MELPERSLTGTTIDAIRAEARAEAIEEAAKKAESFASVFRMHDSMRKAALVVAEGIRALLSQPPDVMLVGATKEVQ